MNITYIYMTYMYMMNIKRKGSGMAPTERILRSEDHLRHHHHAGPWTSECVPLGHMNKLFPAVSHSPLINIVGTISFVCNRKGFAHGNQPLGQVTVASLFPAISYHTLHQSFHSLDLLEMLFSRFFFFFPLITFLIFFDSHPSVNPWKFGSTGPSLACSSCSLCFARIPFRTLCPHGPDDSWILIQAEISVEFWMHIFCPPLDISAYMVPGSSASQGKNCEELKFSVIPSF